MSDLIAQPIKSAAPGQRQLTYTYAQGQLTAAATTLYTAPNTAGQSGSVASMAFLVDMWLANTDTVDRTATLHIVLSGGSASAANMIVPGSTIKTPQGLHFGSLETLIPPGATIQGLASVTSKITYFFTIRLYS